MTDPAADLTLLQYADSFFPSGAVSFSWGLETLCADDCIAAAPEVSSFLHGQLRHRWATCDRPAVAAAHRAADDLDTVASLDRLLEAQTLAAELRDGSRRCGGALLAVHEELGTPGAELYRALVRSGGAPGHLAAVQGLVGRGVGLTLTACEILSAHTLSVGLLGAALRLGMIGHLDAQRSLQRARELIADILAVPAPGVETISAFTPEAEIAVMRHETAETRLFAN
jgi:urease accessory protein